MRQIRYTFLLGLVIAVLVAMLAAQSAAATESTTATEATTSATPVDSTGGSGSESPSSTPVDSSTESTPPVTTEPPVTPEPPTTTEVPPPVSCESDSSCETTTDSSTPCESTGTCKETVCGESGAPSCVVCEAGAPGCAPAPVCVAGEPGCPPLQDCSTNPELFDDCYTDGPPPAGCETTPDAPNCATVPGGGPPAGRLPFTGPGDIVLAVVIALLAGTGGMLFMFGAAGREQIDGLNRRTMDSPSGFRLAYRELLKRQVGD